METLTLEWTQSTNNINNSSNEKKVTIQQEKLLMHVKYA